MTATTFATLSTARPLAAVCVLLTACVSTAVAGASSQSFPPPGRIVYSSATLSLGRDSYSLFTAAADGTGARQITTNAFAADVEARWSPDGTQVVFTRVERFGVTTSVWVVDADGADAHRVSGVPSFAEHPKWSPDGRWIAYQEQTSRGSTGSRDWAGYELWLVRPDGSSLRSLDVGGNFGDSLGLVGYGNAWAWSPDSTQIAFVQENWSDPPPPTINVLDLVTGGKRRLTTGTYPAWSPNGTQLAFVDRCRILLIPAKGGKRTPLTPRPKNDDGCPTDLGWSPDGRWIAATTSSSSWPPVTRVDGARQHTAPSVRPAAVRWPQDCKRLFFYRTPEHYRAGWIVHGPRGLPRFARVPARAIVEGQVDWRC